MQFCLFRIKITTTHNLYHKVGARLRSRGLEIKIAPRGMIFRKMLNTLFTKSIEVTYKFPFPILHSSNFFFATIGRYYMSILQGTIYICVIWNSLNVVYKFRLDKLVNKKSNMPSLTASSLPPATYYNVTAIIMVRLVVHHQTEFMKRW